MQTIEERVSEIFKTDARTLEKPHGLSGIMMPFIYRRLLEKFFRDFESDLSLSIKSECREKHLADTQRIIGLEEEIAELRKQV